MCVFERALYTRMKPDMCEEYADDRMWEKNNNKNHFDCFIIYNVHVVCLLVPDAFEINTKIELSLDFILRMLSFVIVNQSDGWSVGVRQ